MAFNLFRYEYFSNILIKAQTGNKTRSHTQFIHVLLQVLLLVTSCRGSYCLRGLAGSPGVKFECAVTMHDVFSVVFNPVVFLHFKEQYSEKQGSTARL